ncbi:uncharacterized protein METZ01_LOCUS517294, partial [marine metagenome]
MGFYQDKQLINTALSHDTSAHQMPKNI